MKVTNHQLTQMVKSVKYTVDKDNTTHCELDAGIVVVGTARCNNRMNFNKHVGERIAYINALAELRKAVSSE